jgi:hypothetical protein
MAKKHSVIAGVRVKRDDKKFIYYVKSDASVWQAPRRNSKGKSGRKKQLAKFGTAKDMDYGKYIYFVNGKGQVARARRSNGRRRSRGRR